MRERGMEVAEVAVPRLRFGFPCLMIHRFSFFFVFEAVVKGNPTRERGMEVAAIGVPRLRFGFPCLMIHHFSFFFVSAWAIRLT